MRASQGRRKPPVKAEPARRARVARRMVETPDRRTVLAADRTVLAAERTYAAWVRTGLASLASGVAAKKVMGGVLPEWAVVLTGSVLVLFSAACFAAAVWRELVPQVGAPKPQVRRLPAPLLIGLHGFLTLVSLGALLGVWFGRTGGCPGGAAGRNLQAMRTMTEADLPRAGALSALVGWNQNAADWRVFLRDGAVQALDDGDPEALAATGAVLPFGPGLAWVSMILVRPDRRRQGLATAMMHWAGERLAGVPSVALDATPDGREVYRRLGFRDVFGFTRWRLPGPPAAPGAPVRPLQPDDWPALLALDAEAFGAPREALLRGFAARLPAAAWLAADGSGFALGRDGLRAPQIGPVVARDEGMALALIAAARGAIGRPALLDLADAASGIAAALSQADSERLRPFTRMARGAPLPGDPRLLVAMAGPEFG